MGKRGKIDVLLSPLTQSSSFLSVSQACFLLLLLLLLFFSFSSLWLLYLRPRPPGLLPILLLAFHTLKNLEIRFFTWVYRQNIQILQPTCSFERPLPGTGHCPTYTLSTIRLLFVTRSFSLFHPSVRLKLLALMRETRCEWGEPEGRQKRLFLLRFCCL